jgi:DNA-binding NarL/FixJ family response regulator
VPLRLLLVDDDEAYLDALTSMLGSDDRFEILGQANNGAEAVGLAAGLMPDVVVMDVDMPVMEGREATRLIREHHPSMQVVLVSGSEFAEGAFSLLDSIDVAGVSHPYLTKTRVPNELASTILRAGSSNADPRLSELRDRYERGELSLDDFLQATAELAGSGSPEPPPEGEN